MQTSAHEIARLLSQYRFRFDGEKELQAGIERVLDGAGISFEREVKLDAAGTIDFLVEGGLGIEVKIKGSLTALTMQVHRYTREGCLKSFLIVTTKARHRDMPSEMNGKPVWVVWLAHGAFG